METLVQARPLILTLFFASLVIIGIGAFENTGVAFRTGGVTAHIALFLFVLTESFGSISRKRSKTSRNMARVFLVLSGFVVTGIFANLILVFFS
jgi:hypothetical protein